MLPSLPSEPGMCSSRKGFLVVMSIKDRSRSDFLLLHGRNCHSSGSMCRHVEVMCATESWGCLDLLVDREP